MKKHKFHKTTGQLHKDGSATVEHHHSEGPHKNVKHAVQSLDHLHDSLQDHLAGPLAEGSQQLDQGQHGIPPETASAAGIPAGPAPAAAPVPGA